MNAHPSAFESPRVEELRQLIQQGGLTSLSKRHRVGRMIEEIIPSNNRAYGNREFERLAQAVGAEVNAGSLRQLRNFARAFKTQQVRQLEKPSRKGYVLTWTHVVRLLSFPAEKRIELLEECRTGELSVEELDRRILQVRGRRHAGGPRLKRPSGAIDALLQSKKLSEDWIKRAEQVWLGGAQPVITAETIRAGGAEAARVTDETIAVLARLEAIIEEFRTVARAAKTRRPKRKR